MKETISQSQSNKRAYRKNLRANNKDGKVYQLHRLGLGWQIMCIKSDYFTRGE